jgi:hypothetical protein
MAVLSVIEPPVLDDTHPKTALRFCRLGEYMCYIRRLIRRGNQGPVPKFALDNGLTVEREPCAITFPSAAALESESNIETLS